MTMTPTLHTARLILRPHCTADLDACAALWGDPHVVRHIGGVPQDRQAVWYRILRYAGMWAILGHGMWAVEERATGAMIGEAGLLSAERGLQELEGVPEAGWALAPSAWGKGHATEAMGAVLDWADAALPAPAVRCIIEPGNHASITVAGKLGFTAFAEATMHGAPIGIFERLQGAKAPQPPDQAASAGAASR
ncbi:MAG: GNAT family N-acetyltransferase [Sphingobium sp.]